MPVYLIVIIIIAALLLLVDIAASLFFFDYACRRKPPAPDPEADPNSSNPWAVIKPRMDEGIAWIRAHITDQVHITSYDGLKLNAFIVGAEQESDKVVLLMHGFRSHDFHDFACSAKLYHELGYNVVLPDERAHGLSEGKYICFGIRERYDCRDWINYIVERYGENCTVFLGGVSMGCATVTMTLGFELPKNVKGCISDCGFTSPYDIFKSVIKGSFHMPSFPFLNTAAILCRHIAGFGVKEYSTLEAMKVNKLPVLFIHGADDTFVPPWMSEKNYEACKAPKELLMVEGAGHALSFLKAPEKCSAAISDFIKKYEES